MAIAAALNKPPITRNFHRISLPHCPHLSPIHGGNSHPGNVWNCGHGVVPASHGKRGRRRCRSPPHQNRSTRRSFEVVGLLKGGGNVCGRQVATGNGFLKLGRNLGQGFTAGQWAGRPGRAPGWSPVDHCYRPPGRPPPAGRRGSTICTCFDPAEGGLQNLDQPFVEAVQGSPRLDHSGEFAGFHIRNGLCQGQHIGIGRFVIDGRFQENAHLPSALCHQGSSLCTKSEVRLVAATLKPSLLVTNISFSPC